MFKIYFPILDLHKQKRFNHNLHSKIIMLIFFFLYFSSTEKVDQRFRVNTAIPLIMPSKTTILESRYFSKKNNNVPKRVSLHE